MSTTTQLKIQTVPQPTLFTKDGMDYYLVEFKFEKGNTQCTHKEAKKALETGGHVPVPVTDGSNLFHPKLDDQQGWVSLFGCKTNKPDLVGFLIPPRSRATAADLNLATLGGRLMFYHLNHGGNGEHPALCWKKAEVA